MQTEKNSRILSIAVIGLIITNVGLLCFLFFARPHHGPHGGMQPMGMPPMPMHGPAHGAGPHGPDHLAMELNFTSEQKSQMEKIRDSHHSTMKKLLETSQENRKELFDLLSSGDEVKLNAFADSVAANQKQIELATFQHFKQVRAICDEKQKEKFDQIIGGVLEMMAGGMRHAGPLHHGGMHQGPPH